MSCSSIGLALLCLLVDVVGVPVGSGQLAAFVHLAVVAVVLQGHAAVTVVAHVGAL